MTEEPEGGPEPRSESPRRVRWRVGTPAALALCGVLFAVSYNSSEGTDLRPGRYDDMAGLAQAESDAYDRVRDDIAEVEADIAELTQDVEDRRVRQLRQQIDSVSGIAGLEPVSGSGVTVRLSDASPDKLETAEEKGYDANWGNQLVVHQQDIQRVVNAMWQAGARAVTVNGQRIVTTTGIKCEGNAVTLHGVPYPQPYVIQGVGDPERIKAEIDADDRLSGYRAQAVDPNIEIGWEMETEDRIEAPAYDGLLDIGYATPMRSG